MYHRVQLTLFIFFVFSTIFSDRATAQEVEERYWVWVGGSYIKDSKEIYKEYRVPSATNQPTSRGSGVCWVDSKENLWIGYGNNKNYNTKWGTLNDFWKFDGKNWTLMSPPPTLSGRSDVGGNSVGYGISSSSNFPGTRLAPSSWIDKDDNIWLFGGAGFSLDGYYGVLNELWRFNGVNWTLVAGSNTISAVAVYGTMGIGSNLTTPGGIYKTSTWTDKSGITYVFGGYGVTNYLPNYGFLNDLWAFDGKIWTWVTGSQNAHYPPEGRFAAQTNSFPIQRIGNVMWVDSKGLVWIHGGHSYNDSTGVLRVLSDTWTWDGLNWTKIDDQGCDSYKVGTDMPSSSAHSSIWLDDDDTLYMFGGIQAYNSNRAPNQNTWKFNGRNWTLIKGNPLSPTQPGIYGIQGTRDDNNIPGSRSTAAYCRGLNSKTFYMVGGEGLDRETSFGFLSDIWTLSRGNYTSAPTTPTTIPTTVTTVPTVSTVPTVPTFSSDNIQDDPSKSDNSSIIIGASVGGGLLILIVAAIITFLLIRRRRNKPDDIGIELSGPADIDNVDIHEKLGSGKFGDVYRGTWQGATVALKLLKSEEQLKDFLSEVVILKNLNHPNVVRYIGIHAARGGKRYIVTEYLAKGNLKDLLNQEKLNLQVNDLISMAKQVAAGMQYLEQKSVVHRDLAARNLLCAKGDDEGYIVKVGDFGLSRTTEGSDYYRSDDTQIPVKWSAPEVLEYGKSTSKSDVWSFGVVMWEIFSYGKIPYPTMNNQEVMKKVISGYRLECPPNCPEPVYELMTSCWAANPEDRPNFSGLFSKLDVMERVHNVTKRGTQNGSSIVDSNHNAFYGV